MKLYVSLEYENFKTNETHLEGSSTIQRAHVKHYPLFTSLSPCVLVTPFHWMESRPFYGGSMKVGTNFGHQKMPGNSFK